jgi:RNA polymerase subunit RPABC4/transcription elongation factor Spt4
MPEAGRIPVPLRLCRGCRRFVRIENAHCDFCGGDLATLEAEHAASVAEVRAATEALRAALAGLDGTAADSAPTGRPTP